MEQTGKGSGREVITIMFKIFLTGLESYGPNAGKWDGKESCLA